MGCSESQCMPASSTMLIHRLPGTMVHLAQGVRCPIFNREVILSGASKWQCLLHDEDFLNNTSWLDALDAFVVEDGDSHERKSSLYYIGKKRGIT